MKKENQRVFITKQMLRNALLHLLEKEHIDRVSVKELCEEAGVNRSTFYRYYTIPKDILLEMEVELFERFEIKEPFRGQKNVRTYLEETFQFLYDHASLMRLLIRNTTPDDYSVMMNNFAQRMVEAGGVKNISPKKAQLLLAYVSAGSFYTIRQWLSDEKPLEPAELIGFTIDLAEQSLKTIT